jgi:hypothetical protein
MRTVLLVLRQLSVMVALTAVPCLASAQYGSSDEGQYQILSARYGTANRNIDVTQRLKELARQDRTFRMGNSTFGTDPDPGHLKVLRIYARGRNGEHRMFEYTEGSTVDGSLFTGWSRGDWGSGGWNGGWDGPGGGDDGQYQILSARYGTANRNIDVTQRLKELARQDRIFRMGNSTFGTDPDPGHLKVLRIYARGRNGRTRMFEYTEGSTVDGSLFTGWGRGDWGSGGWNGGWDSDDYDRDEGQYQILSARYGTANRNIDVTQRLKELARQDRTFRMGNSTFGTDPDPGRRKVLRIYARARNGQQRMFEYPEGSTVDGSMFTGWGRGDWGYGGWQGGWGERGDRDDRDDWNDRGNNFGRLEILRATYGDGRHNQDVTGRLRSMVRNGSLDIGVGNTSMGGDPAPGSRKTLWVSYSVNGRRQETRVSEGGRLTLP